MLPQDILYGLWQEIVADYFCHNSKDYLLIAELFSKHPFLFHILSQSAQPIVPKLSAIIAQYGPPNILYTDIAPLYGRRI